MIPASFSGLSMHTGRDTSDDDLFRCDLTPLIPYANDLTYVGEADPLPPFKSLLGEYWDLSLHLFKVLGSSKGSCKCVL